MTGEAEWRARALDAEEAVRQLVGWVKELDSDPTAPAGYVTGDATAAAVRRAMRNPARGTRSAARRRRMARTRLWVAS